MGAEGVRGDLLVRELLLMLLMITVTITAGCCKAVVCTFFLDLTVGS